MVLALGDRAPGRAECGPGEDHASLRCQRRILNTLWPEGMVIVRPRFGRIRKAGVRRNIPRWRTARAWFGSTGAPPPSGGQSSKFLPS